jgi:CBS domain-containing protein
MARIPVVAEIMTPDPKTVTPRERVADAAREMELRSIRHLPVTDREGRLIGLLSQRDVLAAKNGTAFIGDIMSQAVKTVMPENAAYEAAYLLLHHKIGCLPVVGPDGRLVGIITESDFVRVAFDMLGSPVPLDEMELEEEQAERL